MQEITHEALAVTPTLKTIKEMLNYKNNQELPNGKMKHQEHQCDLRDE